MTLQTLVLTIVAAAALLAGRRLFWLFVSVVGFMVGFQLAVRFAGDIPDWGVLLIGLGFGLLGALVAVFLQYVAAGLAGFGAGALVAVSLLTAVGAADPPLVWLAGLIGGVLGAVLLLAFFDWGLILLSAASGAAVLTELWLSGPLLAPLAFIALLVLGVLVQRAAFEPAVIEKRRTVVRR